MHGLLFVVYFWLIELVKYRLGQVKRTLDSAALVWSEDAALLASFVHEAYIDCRVRALEQVNNMAVVKVATS